MARYHMNHPQIWNNKIPLWSECIIPTPDSLSICRRTVASAGCWRGKCGRQERVREAVATVRRRRVGDMVTGLDGWSNTTEDVLEYKCTLGTENDFEGIELKTS